MPKLIWVQMFDIIGIINPAMRTIKKSGFTRQLKPSKSGSKISYNYLFE